MPIVRVTIVRMSVIVRDLKSDHRRGAVNMRRCGVNMLAIGVNMLVIVMSMVVVVIMTGAMIVVVVVIMMMIVSVPMIMMSMRVCRPRAACHQTPEPLVEQRRADRDYGEPRYRPQHRNDLLRDHILREAVASRGPAGTR